VVGKGEVLIDDDSKIADRRRVRCGRSEIGWTKVGRIG
jgi:hypothetical protein